MSECMIRGGREGGKEIGREGGVYLKRLVLLESWIR